MPFRRFFPRFFAALTLGTCEVFLWRMAEDYESQSLLKCNTNRQKAVKREKVLGLGETLGTLHCSPSQETLDQFPPLRLRQNQDSMLTQESQSTAFTLHEFRPLQTSTQVAWARDSGKHLQTSSLPQSLQGKEEVS
jgi:hypothetical protein